MSAPVVQQGRGALRDGRHKGWFYCDNLVFDLTLSKHAKLVYLFLARCAGDGDQAFPSFETIMAKTGLSHGSVVKALQELDLAKLIRRKPRRGQHGHQTSTIYTLLDTAGLDSGQQVTAVRGQQVTGNKKHLTTEPKEESQNQNLSKPRIESADMFQVPEGPETSTSTAPLGVPNRTAARARPAVPPPDPNQERFEIFWSWIPKRLSTGRGTKAEAWAMWNQGAAPTAAQARAMTRLLSRYLADAPDADFYDQLGDPLMLPADLVWYCWEAMRRRVQLSEVIYEEFPDLVPLERILLDDEPAES